MLIRMNQLCKILCSFCFFLSLCKYRRNRCREPTWEQYRQQRCRWKCLLWIPVMVRKEQPIKLGLKNVLSETDWTWMCPGIFLSQAKNPAVRQADCPQLAQLTQEQAPLLLSANWVWSVWSSHGFKMFLAICYGVICACQPNLQLARREQNLSPEDACQAEHGIFFCLLSKTLAPLFASVVSSFSSSASPWCFLKAGKKKKKNKPNSTAFWLLSVLWLLSPHRPPGITASVTHTVSQPRSSCWQGCCFLWKQGKAEASQCADAFSKHMLNYEANLVPALPHGYLGSFQTGICFAMRLCFLTGQKALMALFVQLRFKPHVSGAVSMQSCQLR